MMTGEGKPGEGADAMVNPLHVPHGMLFNMNEEIEEALADTQNAPSSPMTAVDWDEIRREGRRIIEERRHERRTDCESGTTTHRHDQQRKN